MKLTWKEIHENLGKYQGYLVNNEDHTLPSEERIPFSLMFGPLMVSHISFNELMQIPLAGDLDINMGQFFAICRCCQQAFEFHFTPVASRKDEEHMDMKKRFMERFRQLDAFIRAKAEHVSTPIAIAARTTCMEYMKESALPQNTIQESFLLNSAPIVPYGNPIGKEPWKSQTRALVPENPFRKKEDEDDDELDYDAVESAMTDITQFVQGGDWETLTLKYLEQGPYTFDAMDYLDKADALTRFDPHKILKIWTECNAVNVDNPDVTRYFERLNKNMECLLEAFGLYYNTTQASLEGASLFLRPDWMLEKYETIIESAAEYGISVGVDPAEVENQLKEMDSQLHHALYEIDPTRETIPLVKIDNLRNYLADAHELQGSRHISSLFLGSRSDNLALVGEIDEIPVAQSKKTGNLIIPVVDITMDNAPFLVILKTNGEVELQPGLNTREM